MIELKNVKKHYMVKASVLSKEQIVKAVDGISFNIHEGESFGLIGESGSGKSTLGNLICKMIAVTEGQVYFLDEDITKLKGKALRRLRKDIQVIAQSGKEILDPKMTIKEHLEAPLRVHDICDFEDFGPRIEKLLLDVGLSTDVLNQYPYQLSGGMLQRVTIARALAVEPKLIICDEPVSALDVSIQGLIINLLSDLKKKYHFTYLFITHNLKVVKHVCNRIAVIKEGNLIELGETNQILTEPKEDYTKLLVGATMTK